MKLERFKVTGIARQGVYHQAENTPCQDNIAYWKKENSVCAVLCDGAGSISNSEYISEFCCNSIANDIKENIELWLSQDNERIRNKILELTECALQKEGKHADCTLLLFVQKEDASLLVHIGDGIVLGVPENNDETVILSMPENGKDTSHTFFLSGTTAYDHLRINRNINDKYDCIILSSDGIQNLLFNFINHKPVRATQIIREWIKESEEIAKRNLINASTDVFEHNTYDDIGVIVTRR